MRPTHSSLSRRILATWLALAAGASLASQSKRKSYDLKIDGDTVRLSQRSDTGISLRDLIFVCEKVTGKWFTFTKDEIARAGRIQLIEPLETDRKRFFGFLQTLLYLKGFACAMRGPEGNQLVRIICVRGVPRAEGSGGCLHTPIEFLRDLEQHFAVNLLTKIDLKHLTAGDAGRLARRLLTTAAGSAPVNYVASERKTLLLHGRGGIVIEAVRFLQMIDGTTDAHRLVIESLEPQPASVAEIASALTQLVQPNETKPIPNAPKNPSARSSDKSWVSVRATSDRLLLCGPPDRVVAARERITRLKHRLAKQPDGNPNDAILSLIKVRHGTAGEFFSILDASGRRTSHKTTPSGIRTGTMGANVKIFVIESTDVIILQGSRALVRNAEARVSRLEHLANRARSKPEKK